MKTTCISAKFLSFVAAGVTAAFLMSATEAALAQPFSPTWASVDKHPPAPEWFQDAKFGIYFHWGVYSVPAYGNEWYPREMYQPGTPEYTYHIQTYGGSSVFPYNHFITGGYDKTGHYVQFAPKLKSQGGNFDPDAWAQLFVDAGAKFAGPSTEHHDGFSMWNSQVNEWNSVQKGPKLDLLGLFEQAIRAKGLKFLAALHTAYNFNGYYQYVPPQTDPSLQKLFGQLPTDQENQLWLNELQEVINGYQPDIIWEDFDLVNVYEQNRLQFLADYYNSAAKLGKQVVATYKDGFDKLGEVFDYERGGPGDIVTPYWLTDDAISPTSWCYVQGITFYSLQQEIDSLIDKASKNGNLLFNISPMADGTIPQQEQEILLGIGDWLNKFGESIYATRYWMTYGEGPTKMGGGSFVAPVAGTAQDIRFTRTKDNKTLYAIAMGWPTNGAQLSITTFNANRIDLTTLKSVQLLGPEKGSYIPLTWTQDGNALNLVLPQTPPYNAYAYAIRLDFKGQIPVLHPDQPVVTTFDAPGYKGPAIQLGIGNYSAAQLAAAGVKANAIRSAQIVPGYLITAYDGDNFTGNSWTLNSDTANISPHAGIVSLTVTFDPNAYFEIVNVTNGLALDGNGATTEGSDVLENAYSGSPTQQWHVASVGSGVYTITNRSSGLVIDGRGLSTNGTPLGQWQYDGSTNLQWAFGPGHSSYKIINQTSGLVIDSGGNVPPGSDASESLYDGSTNRQWRLTKVN
jgi:alpha-L-fucosidase